MAEKKGQDQDLRTFLEEKDIEFSGLLPEEVKEAVRKCGELVVLLSEYSVARPWVSVEVGAAWVLGRPPASIASPCRG